MIIDFKTNVGTAAYDSDTILQIEYSEPPADVEITYRANNKLEPKILSTRHYIKDKKEFAKILDQWKKSKEPANGTQKQ